MSEQLFLEAFNSEPYFFEKEEKYGAMDIIYTFEDEAGHGFKFHFEKKVALGKYVYVCVLSQKTPGLKTYKRVIGKFSNPMRTVATLLAVVRDIHATRKDVHGIVMSIPEQAFGSYSRLVKKIMTRELRTVLNVEDGEYTPEDFEKMGLVGIVTTVKPRNMNTVYTGPALKEYQDRQEAAKDGYGFGAPAAVVPDVKAPAAVKKPDFAAPVEVTFDIHAPDGRTLTLAVDHLSGVSTKDSDGNFVSEKAIKSGDTRIITNAMREYTNVAKMVPLIQMSLNDGYTVASVPQYRGKVASKGITELNKPNGPVDLPKQTSVAQTMTTQGDVKEPYYFDYDHRQITLTFDNVETASRVKDQLLEMGAATFNDNEFFTDKEKLILVDGNALDVKKVQATLFPILGNPLMMNGVNLDPNVRSSVRSPDGVTYHIKCNTIQVEDAPKDAAMAIIREILPMADRIFDDKGSNILELNSQGIADGFSIDNIAPVLKKSNLAKRLSAKLFRSWEKAASEASDKYELSTGDFRSSFTNNSSYLIDIATSGVVGEYSRTAGNVISGIVLKSNYKIREAVAKPLVALGFTVEYDVQGWRTQVKLPVNSDYTIPGTSELALFIKEVDNLANIARNRTVEEFVGGNKNFRAKWSPDTSRVSLVLPTAESSDLGWRDYTAYATSPNHVRVDNIESYEDFLKLVEYVKNFDFGANLLLNIGVSKYLSDVRSGGAKASKTYKLKDGGEVEISFKFGDKVLFIFNQNSEGFDKEMSEFAGEKVEISGRASAIPLYMLGTSDANKTLKNIDAWLDAHIVSKEDNSSKDGNQSTEDLIDQEIQSKISWAEDILRESLSHNTSGQTVAKIEYVGTSRPTENHVLYIFKLLVQPKYGAPVSQKAFVKGTIGLDVVTGYSGTGKNRQPMIKPVSIALDRSVTSWVGFDYDPKEADQYEKTMSFEVKSKGEEFKYGDKVIVNNARSYNSMATSDKVEGVVELVSGGRVYVKVGTGQSIVDPKDLQKVVGVSTKQNAEDSFQVTLNGYDGEDDVYGIDEISVAITGSENVLANMKAKLTPIIAKYNIEELKVMDGGKALVAFFDKYSSNSTAKRFIDFVNNEFKGSKSKAAGNDTNPIAAKPEKVKQSGTLEIVASIASSNENHYIIVQDGVLTTKSAYGSPRTEGFWRFSPKGMTFSEGEELVKAEIMKLYNSGASNLVIKAKVNEWLKPRGGYVIDVRGDRTNRGVKDVKKNLISTLEKLKTEGETKKLTGVDLRAGVTRAYNGQTGRVEKLYSIEGQAEQISELYKQLRSVTAFSGMKGKFEVEFWNPSAKGSTKHKVSFSEGGAVIPSSMLSAMGNYVRVTQSDINLSIAKDFDTSPEAVVNEFMSYVGISNWHYNIKKKDIKQAIYLAFDINAIKAIDSVEVSSLNESTQIDEGIKEDLTGKAPNRVKRELLEATLRKLGLYRESFTYGNATFKTVMSECAVEIIPTSGNIRNFAKMLGARLGQELRIDDEGFLSFDLDNI